MRPTLSDPADSCYQKHISGPLLDRIDVHTEKTPRVCIEKLTDGRLGETLETIRARVEQAREIQWKRFAGTPLTCNTDMGPTFDKLRTSLAGASASKPHIWPR